MAARTHSTKNAPPTGRHSDGSRRFNKWVETHQFAKSRIAEELGISRWYLYLILYHGHEPRIRMAGAIEALTRGYVTVRSWTRNLTRIPKR